MSALTAVMQREIKEKKSVVIAAAIFGVLPPVIHIYGVVRGHETRHIAAMLLGFVVAAMVFGVACATGASLFTRELAEKRLGFYLARPISELSLWGGKLFAAFLLAFAAGAIPLILGLIFGVVGNDFTTLWSDIWNIRSVVVGAAAMLFLMLLMHAASVAVRSRSGWMALEIVTFVVSVAMVTIALRPMLASGAFGFLGLTIVVGVAATALALLIGGIVGVVRGRTEIVLVQRYTATAFSIVIFASAVAYSGYAYWIRSADRDDLSYVSATGATTGALVAVHGHVFGGLDYIPSFVVDPTTGREVRFANGGRAVRMSPAGRAAWEQLTDLGRSPRFALTWTDFSEKAPQPRETTIEVNGNFALSPDGGRIAMSDGKLLKVYELPSERLIASVRVPDSAQSWFFRYRFASDDLLYVYAPRAGTSTNERRFGIFEVSLLQKSIRRTGEVRGDQLRLTPDEKQLLAFDRVRSQLNIADPITGAISATMQFPPTNNGWRGFAYVSGRIATLLRFGNRSELRVFDGTGKLERIIEIAGAAGAIAVGPRTDSVVFVAQSIDGRGPYATYIASLQSGSLSEYLRYATPVAGFDSTDFADPLPGAPVTRLFGSPRGVFMYDEQQKTKQLIAGRL